MVHVSTAIGKRYATGADPRPCVAQRQNTLAHVIALTSDVDRSVQWTNRLTDPFTDGGSRIDIYVDNLGYEYWAHAENGRLIQVGRSADCNQTPFADRQAGRLSVHELRDLAVSLVVGQIPDFHARRSGLHPLEDNTRKRIYYFRWDDMSSPAEARRTPPFVQVSLWADGELHTYTDTLPR